MRDGLLQAGACMSVSHHLLRRLTAPCSASGPGSARKWKRTWGETVGVEAFVIPVCTADAQSTFRALQCMGVCISV